MKKQLGYAALGCMISCIQVSAQNAAEKQICDGAFRFMNSGPNAFIAIRGKQINTSTWETQQSGGSARCTVSQRGERHSFRCSVDQSSKTDAMKFYEEQLVTFYNCIGSSPYSSDFSTRSSRSSEDGEVFVTRRWQRDNDSTEFQIVVSRIENEAVGKYRNVFSFQYDRND